MKAHSSPALRALARLAGPSALVLALSLGFSGTAQAVDGCKLLLCLAGTWQNISQCTPTVRQALRDVARGRAWPTCAMGGSSASGNQFVMPEQCPQQYIGDFGTNEGGGQIYSCPFSGVIHVAVDGQPWSRTWWSPSGDSVVEWLPAAKQAFANTPQSMDDRFERDLATWLRSGAGQPASTPGPQTPSQEGGS